jgi:hypothetical protein
MENELWSLQVLGLQDRLAPKYDAARIKITCHLYRSVHVRSRNRASISEGFGRSANEVFGSSSECENACLSTVLEYRVPEEDA